MHTRTKFCPGVFLLVKNLVAPSVDISGETLAPPLIEIENALLLCAQEVSITLDVKDS